MCGIAGQFGVRGSISRTALSAMGEVIAHRGPDDAAVWTDSERRVGLSHRRLAILDLSDAGSQPMTSRSGRFTVAFNGEIYNHPQLRRELPEPPCGWRGHSDTETLLACFERYGVGGTLPHLVGMFAVAVWDHSQARLHLVRDRMGEKPLYWGHLNGLLVFASELKSIAALPNFTRQVDRQSLALLLRRAYVPTPRSIYQGIFKLEPGCHLSVSENGLSSLPANPVVAPYKELGLRIERYWSLAEKAQSGQQTPFYDRREAMEQLEAQLSETLRMQSLSDVPLGAFLSGGVDSSTVCALLQEQTRGQLKTFTIGFSDALYDESRHARRVAAHLGTDHHEAVLDARTVQNVIPHLARLYDEPFADSSQIPTHLVAKMAREHVTVALSGDGGDELFGGYTRYLAAARLWRSLRHVPGPLRGSAGRMLQQVPPAFWRALAQMPVLASLSNPAAKADKLGLLLRRAGSLQELYASLINRWGSSTLPVHGYTPGEQQIDWHSSLAEPEHAMMLADGLTYLPDDILCKVDRAAMATSLETRVPFLDHRVVEIAWRMPLSMKIEEGRGKVPLRALLYKRVPRDLIERPKQGFAIPIGAWLRTELRDWAEELLRTDTLRDFFDPVPIRAMWLAHQDGKRDHLDALWSVLMFQQWRREWGAA